MQFEQHHWTDPANITATELNRIEQGIKNSQDVLSVLGTELANAQSKQAQLTQLVEGLVANSPSVLETIASIQRLLDANPTLLTTLSSTANIVTTRILEDKLRNYLPLKDIRQNGVSIVYNSIVDITTPSSASKVTIRRWN